MNEKIFRFKETVAKIIAEEEYISVAKEEIKRQYELIEDYIKTHPKFYYSLEPLPFDPLAPEIVRRMLKASERAGVGPMAAVAGAIAEFSLKAMLKAGAEQAIVANGGDIALFVIRPAIIRIFTGPALIKNLGLRIFSAREILGICTSSGTVGHSLSFGIADAATVISTDVCLADAFATALGNAVQKKDEGHLQEALESIPMEGIKGLLAVVDDLMAIRGNLPELVQIPEGVVFELENEFLEEKDEKSFKKD